jgi:uncharacterized protein YheU (UPF0270 family)
MQIIPYERLSEEALHGIILEFVTREGGNNHDQDRFSADDMCAQVMQQLENGDVTIVFDTRLGSCSIIPANHLE